MKRTLAILLLVLTCSSAFALTDPQKPYADLVAGDTLKPAWLAGMFDTLYTWCQNHGIASGATHGITGDFVGTTDTQTISGKSLTSPTLTGTVAADGTTVTGSITRTGTTTGGTTSGGTLSGTTTNSGTISGGTVTASTLTSSTIGSTNSISGDAVNSGTVADARIDSALARDSEVTSAVSNHNAVTNAHSATSANTASTIVMRDGSNNINATTFTGNLSGNVTGNVTGNVSGSSGSCTGNSITATTATNANYVANDAYNMRFHWNGQSGTPTYVWGSNDGQNTYVWQPANFSVNYATSAGTSSACSGNAATSSSCSGNAANVTGTVAVANGGTGATSAASARTNLGLGSAAIRNEGSGNGLDADKTDGLHIKTLTGTTSGSEGGNTQVAHGLTSSKIIYVSAMVQFATGQGIIPCCAEPTGYNYAVTYSATNVTVINHSTNSESILSKPFTVTILYTD